jgi:hypothetical protein
MQAATFLSLPPSAVLGSIHGLPSLDGAPEVFAIWSLEEGSNMPLTLRFYLFEESGVIKRIPRRVQEGCSIERF